MTAIRTSSSQIDSMLTNLECRLICAGNLRYRKMIRERGRVRSRLRRDRTPSAVPVLSANGCPLCGSFSLTGPSLRSDAAADFHAADPHPPAGGDNRLAHDDRAACPGAAGAIDAPGAYRGVGFGRLKGHGRAEGEKGGCNDQQVTHVGLPDFVLLMFSRESFFLRVSSEGSADTCRGVGVRRSRFGCGPPSLRRPIVEVSIRGSGSPAFLLLDRGPL